MQSTRMRRLIATVAYYNDERLLVRQTDSKHLVFRPSWQFVTVLLQPEADWILNKMLSIFESLVGLPSSATGGQSSETLWLNEEAVTRNLGLPTSWESVCYATYSLKRV